MMNDFHNKLIKLVLVLLGFACIAIGYVWSASASPGATRARPERFDAQRPTAAFFPAQQSTTGPRPPLAVQRRDASKQPDSPEDLASEVTLNVPAYLWRHGCGPTAVGMILGYYDGLGYDDLLPGSAITQTYAVNQAMASGGDAANPFPPGSENHYEDYARPEDDSPPIIEDDYITSGRIPHADNSVADYMDTSKSTRNNLYGWSWSSDVGPAFVDYVNQQNPAHLPGYQTYYYLDGTMTWNVLTAEIDAGRPMIFLVDSDGDGTTDHFMPVIGYRDSPTLQYGAWDTWSTTDIRWEDFTGMAAGTPWGIFGGVAFTLSQPVPTATASSTPTPTSTPTATSTSTPTPTATNTSTSTSTATSTSTPTTTHTPVPGSSGGSDYKLFLPIIT